ncbi:unnamed protein product [Clavelina lepadiformis]|uniref:Uncharacterized protein n=1 Tax=Clavelina lepadiformis TaxID=159417 RepID=A0ABP0GB07_CLALP
MSKHKTGEVEAMQSSKPEIINYYNETKDGVDTMDKMLGEYTGTQPRFQEKGPAEKVSERSCETAMYAFSGSSLYQTDGDEKPFPSSCSGNGSRTAHCDTARRDCN